MPKRGSFSRKKKVKTSHTLEDLPWKAVSRKFEAGAEDDEGILEFEEIEGVEVVYDETESGRVLRFNLVQEKEVELTSTLPETVKDSSQISTSSEDELYEPFDSEKLLPYWHSYFLHPQLLRALLANNFLRPTPIQSTSLPPAFKNRDVVGISQTGSGKTLAYGLPILHYFLSRPRPIPEKKREIRSLILAPTRELALQVSSHLNAFLTLYAKNEAVEQPATDVRQSCKSGKKRRRNMSEKEVTFPVLKVVKTPPHVSIAALVGGMSSQKQRRVLDRGVDILVATPGRLWDVIGEGRGMAEEIRNLRFLVLDEADRMIETGHFAELEHILRLTLRKYKGDRVHEVREAGGRESVAEAKDDLQTFVFSATLSKDLQRNVKQVTRSEHAMQWKKRQEKPASSLDDLLLRLDFRDPDPVVVDLSPAGGVVPTLQESKIECLSADKDVYLYYFLLRYPGRSLVFLSSIDGIRRLMPLMDLLQLKAFPLHSQLEQRQRLKNLDRFKNTPSSILLATDIASRGLDIPAVDHVVHYQIPRSADVYIHRNGRTARAERKGFSMFICAPDERRVVRALLNNLERLENEIPSLPVALDVLDKLKYRVQLARSVEIAQHKVKKAKFEKKWMKETADAMEIELDSDYLSEDRERPSNRERRFKDAKTTLLKTELNELLSKPLFMRGISAKYITSGHRPIADELLSGKFHKEILGAKSEEAGQSLGVRQLH